MRTVLSLCLGIMQLLLQDSGANQEFVCGNPFIANLVFAKRNESPFQYALIKHFLQGLTLGFLGQ
jgi:hypothetical protein